ncbi:thiamine phosphate synthase [Hymenobacter mucosus]|uniref:Thiamine-phosphate pyrophosphorylase n=1 Tax=Hymenobacter mucosus TaxID=1411120 RepID=A0A238ZD41_9BACT|nr:thiamine phosphate synthase [Hymenobacter mucosus]SNR80624.1 thiamine-phosphate pyrophosphorylase [Hymenobacter mucosus]
MVVPPFSLLSISPPERVENEVELLCQLFAQGLTTAHIRKPDWSSDELTNYLQQIPAVYLHRVVVHSAYELALQFPIKGIHLTESSRRQPTIGTLLQKLRRRSISASFHDLNAIATDRRQYDYVLLSPIFDSVSKEGYKSNFSLAEVQNTLAGWQRHNTYIPQVIALGGVLPSNIRSIQQAGFAGAAVLGGIWQQPDPIVAFKNLQAEINQLNIQ